MGRTDDVAIRAKLALIRTRIGIEGHQAEADAALESVQNAVRRLREIAARRQIVVAVVVESIAQKISWDSCWKSRLVRAHSRAQRAVIGVAYKKSYGELAREELEILYSFLKLAEPRSRV